MSGEIVSIVRARVSAESKRRSILPLTGWLASLDVPETHGAFREARHQLSSDLLTKMKRKTRRK